MVGSFTAAFAASRVDAAVRPPPPSTEDGDTFGVYVADQETYDSNLYRLPSNIGSVSTVVSPNATRDDAYNTVSLGGSGQWVAGRQVLDLDLLANENRFSHNDMLNNTGVDGKFAWYWSVAPYFSGQVGADFNRALASFAETRYLGRDLVDTKNYFGTARYQVGPRWAVFGGVRDVQFSHGVAVQQYNNFTNKSGNAGIEYATNVNDTFQLEYNYSDGYYPQDYVLNGTLFNRNYHENTTRFLVQHAFTDKTALNANAGYLKRDYLAAGAGHFSGNIWRVSLDWKPTDKTDLVAAAWHELHAYSVNESNYFISKGGSLAPVWAATEKLRFSLVFSLEDQNYINSSTSVVTSGPLSAKIIAQQLNILYTPRDRWFFNAFFRHERRNSNQASFAFDDQLANVSVTYKIH